MTTSYKETIKGVNKVRCLNQTYMEKLLPYWSCFLNDDEGQTILIRTQKSGYDYSVNISDIEWGSKTNVWGHIITGQDIGGDILPVTIEIGSRDSFICEIREAAEGDYPNLLCYKEKTKEGKEKPQKIREMFER